MSDRVASDHPAVDTHRAEIVRHGSTRRPMLSVPTDVAPSADVVRLVIEGHEYHTPVDERDDAIRFLGAYDSPRHARERDGTERLGAWVSEHDLDFGRTVPLDIVTPGYRYGLRRPGERAVYEPTDPPNKSLRDIAAGLDED